MRGFSRRPAEDRTSAHEAETDPQPAPLVRRLAWFALFWAAGVGTIYLVATLIRFALKP